jgi:uroporphyrinogen-III synthase
MPFAGLHVAAFESRRADDMARLIERHGGLPHVAASMREVPLDENREAVDFAHRLITAEIDLVIFLTGVGIKHLVAAIENTSIATGFSPRWAMPRPSPADPSRSRC